MNATMTFKIGDKVEYTFPTGVVHVGRIVRIDGDAERPYTMEYVSNGYHYRVTTSAGKLRVSREG